MHPAFFELHLSLSARFMFLKDKKLVYKRRNTQPHTTMPYNMQSYVKDQEGGWVTSI